MLIREVVPQTFDKFIVIICWIVYVYGPRFPIYSTVVKITDNYLLQSVLNGGIPYLIDINEMDEWWRRQTFY